MNVYFSENIKSIKELKSEYKHLKDHKVNDNTQYGRLNLREEFDILHEKLLEAEMAKKDNMHNVHLADYLVSIQERMHYKKGWVIINWEERAINPTLCHCVYLGEVLEYDEAWAHIMHDQYLFNNN